MTQPPPPPTGRRAAADGPSGIPQIPGLVYVQPLGSGGYADVYLFEQQSPRMPVAVKVLKAAGLTDAVRAQFGREADTMAALGDHPNIVQIFRSGVSTDGRPYLVMKYYPPPNLAVRSRAERFAVGDVLRMGIQLASAVETAHRANITHRDIKPGNVLISPYGAPGLTDFGIAGRGRLAGAPLPGEDAALDEAALDDVGVSVPWAAPEVLYGRSDGDPRSDVYSLAATLWQLLVGRSPFEVPGGDNTAYALMPRIRATPAPPTGRPDVPTSLERVLAHALAKDPLARPASALEFARMLQSVEQEQRLPRTQIVVLDDYGNTTLLQQGADGPGDPGTAGDTDAERTRVRVPKLVMAQRPEETTGAPVTGGATGAATGLATGAATRATPATAPAPDSADETTVRPRRLAAAQTPIGHTARTAPGTPGGTGAGPGVPTTAPSTDPTGASTSASTPRRTVPLWALVAGTVGLVVLGAVVALLWRQFGSQPVPPRPPIVASVQDSDPADAVYERPVLTVAENGPNLTFTWTYAGPRPGASFRIKAGPSSDAAAQSAPKQLTTATWRTTVPARTSVCASVAVVRNGVESPWSQPVCGARA